MAIHASLAAPAGPTLVKASAVSGLAFTAVFGWKLRQRMRVEAADSASDFDEGQTTPTVSRTTLRGQVQGAFADTLAIPARPLRWIDSRVGVRARAGARIGRIPPLRRARERLPRLEALASAAARRLRPAALRELPAEPAVRIRRITSDAVRRFRDRGANGSDGARVPAATGDEPSAG